MRWAGVVLIWMIRIISAWQSRILWFLKSMVQDKMQNLLSIDQKLPSLKLMCSRWKRRQIMMLIMAMTCDLHTNPIFTQNSLKLSSKIKDFSINLSLEIILVVIINICRKRSWQVNLTVKILYNTTLNFTQSKIVKVIKLLRSKRNLFSMKWVLTTRGLAKMEFSRETASKLKRCWNNTKKWSTSFNIQGLRWRRCTTMELTSLIL